MRKALVESWLKKSFLNIYPNVTNCSSFFHKSLMLESVCGVSRGSNYEFAAGTACITLHGKRRVKANVKYWG